MNSTDLKHFKILFNAMKEQLLTKAALEDERLSTLNAGDIIDQSTNEREAHLQLKLQGRDRLFLKKIDHALEKIENNTFGECEECGEQIGLNRLLARPIATQCIHCKEEQEREEGQVLYQTRSKTNGQALNNTNSNVSFGTDENGLGEPNVVNLSKWAQKLEKETVNR